MDEAIALTRPYPTVPARAAEIAHKPGKNFKV
jgi:hypothetical protein